MEMEMMPPPARLRGQVRALWVLRGRPVGRYQGLPKPYAELIVSLAGSHCWYSEPGAAGVRFEEGWLTPVQAAPRYAETAGELHLVGARLEPAACAQLFGVAVQRGLGYPIPLAALLGGAAWRLREQLYEAPTARGKMETLAGWIGDHLEPEAVRCRLPGRARLAALNWRVDALAEELSLSPRGLRKRFAVELGLSPKLWLQLGRFDAALRGVGSAGGLAELAARHGYADQAHMNNEFRRFGGQAPGEYLRLRQEGAAPSAAPHFVPKVR
jgi:AraC-like DNA-binding protein